MGTIFRLTLRKWERTSPSNGTQPLVLPAFLSLPGGPVGGFWTLSPWASLIGLEIPGSRAESSCVHSVDAMGGLGTIGCAPASWLRYISVSGTRELGSQVSEKSLIISARCSWKCHGCRQAFSGPGLEFHPLAAAIIFSPKNAATLPF